MKVNWSQLEAKLELSQLPQFHRAFLALHRPELQAESLPLRRVQQYVGQTLSALAQQGLAVQQGADFFIERHSLPPAYWSLFE